MGRLENKVAIISGGGTGIGKATAELFRKEGAKPYLLGRKEKPLKKMSSLTNTHYSICDISQADQVEKAVRKAYNLYHRIDILVNNAGVFLNEKPLVDLDEKILNETLATNITGTLLLSKYVLKKMIEQQNGSIVNVASILGFIGAENTICYGASKGAIIAATKHMAVEYAKYGIRVNCVSPSVTNTGMVRSLLKNPDLEKSLRTAHLLERFAEPEEIAHAILYLASDESSFLTGHNLILDAGRSISD